MTTLTESEIELTTSLLRKIGEPLYVVNKTCGRSRSLYLRVVECTICGVHVSRKVVSSKIHSDSDKSYIVVRISGCGDLRHIELKKLNSEVFFSKDEAYQVLEELEKENHGSKHRRVAI